LSLEDLTMLTGPRCLDQFSPAHGNGFVLNHPKDIGYLGSSPQEGTPKVMKKMDWDKEIETLRERGNETTTKDKRLIDITVNIGYTDNVEKVVSLIKRVLRETDKLMKDPEPELGIGDMDPSNIQIHVKPWCPKDAYWDAMAGLVRNLKMSLYKEGITYRSVKSNN
jgi:hypothetical protein